ncbi:alpha-protein kinase 2 isoform 2-T5 [Odontesthes bonariensis]|uniref:alpha-protein kinase 2 isoform X2 n=1 Tax=Odontesthes bonariensis TaxID=219752 RepID=UPI003F58D61F
MDLSLLCTDDQRRSAPAPEDSQTKDSDSVCFLLSARETVTDSVCEFSVTTDISTLNVSAQEKIPDSDGLKSSLPSCNTSQDFSHCSEPSPNDDDLRVCCCLGTSEPTLPLLPQFSHDFFPPQSSFTEFCVKQDPLFPFSVRQEISTEGSEAAEGLIEPFTTEPFASCNFNFKHSQPTPLHRSLSPQSDSLDSDIVVAPMSDLYIFESDTHDFNLSQTIDPRDITCPEYQPFSETGVGKANHDCGTHVAVCDSAGIVTRCHHRSTEKLAIEGGVSEVSQHEELRAPAVDAWEVDLMSVNDVRLEKAEVTGLTLQLQRSDSPIEHWLDACQYLTGEMIEDREILDKTGHSVMRGGHSASTESCSPPEETKVSDCNPDGCMGIGWCCDDTRGWGPPVERWSSVDSWATALSDWTGILESPPEDLTAAFAEIGAEIDALTQALEEVNTHTEADILQEDQETVVQEKLQETMGLQDQPLKTQNIPESSIQSGQSCLSFCLEAAGPALRDKGGPQSYESLCDPATTRQEEKKPEELQSCQAECSPPPTAQHSSMGSSCTTVASTGGQSVDETEVTLTASPSSSDDLDLSQFDGYSKFFEPDFFMSDKDYPVILNITEYTDLITPTELVFEEPRGDGLCQVTDERSFPQLGSVGTQQVDCEGNKSIIDLNFLTTRTLTISDVPVVDTQPDLRAPESFNTAPDLNGAHQEAPQLGSPEFIMPLAPLNGGSSLVCRTNSSLEGDQTCAKRSLNDSLCCDHVQHCTLCPTPDGITDKLSVEGDDKLIRKKQNTTNPAEIFSLGELQELHTNDTAECFLSARKTEEIIDLRREHANFTFFPSDHFIVSEESRVAYVTLDLNDPFFSGAAEPVSIVTVSEKSGLKMPHKTHKNPSEGKTRSKKEKSSGHHHGEHALKKTESISHHVSTQQTCKQQESHSTTGENQTNENTAAELEATEAELVIETVVATEKGTSKPHGKKKKKHGQNATIKIAGEPSNDVENRAKPKTAKGRIDMFEAKLGPKVGKAQKDADLSVSAENKPQQPETKPPQEEQPQHHRDHKDHKSKNISSPLKDDAIKRRRVSGDRFGKIVSVLESKLPKAETTKKAKGEETQAEVGAARKKAYSEVVKQNIIPTEDLKVVKPIQAVSVIGDTQSLCLWCQFSAALSDNTVSWTREGNVLAEIKRSAGDESRVSLTIANASHKDLGKYQCRISSLHGSVTLDYLLTYEVLSEIVIPPSPKTVSDQHFGEKHPASIVTEKVHFGEGMHRRAFRTKLQAGQIPLLVPGYSCVLKVHNAISYGTNNNDELVQKNFNLAVEECHVQNTAREYIKAYTAAAQAIEAFGDVPEIIPIYLVHRPSNDIPYATLEEELIGDFVKYSVKDGKEINLMRRDSEAGQKCCAFQHWVFQKTGGNLLVTDMQGVGMRLTDVGIATCKKGYKGFKGNCATSFIDQFKVLHLCNKYCEILGLKSMQPKAKKATVPPKPKPQPSAAPKKKTFGPTVKGKS